MAARKLLSTNFKITGAALLKTVAEKTNWPDTSLGCPAENASYAQTIVPGYRFEFELENTKYAVHSNHDGSRVVECMNKTEVKGQD